MSFTAITTGEIAPGQPNKNELWTKVKDNFDDHETRLLAAEGGVVGSYEPLIYTVGGRYDLDFAINSSIPDVCRTTCNFAITITGARIIIGNAGSVGTTTVDILFKRGAGAWTSIFTTKPSVIYSAGDYALSSNAVLNASNVNLLAGDLLRLDITTVQTGGKNFIVRVDYDKA